LAHTRLSRDFEMLASETAGLPLILFPTSLAVTSEQGFRPRRFARVVLDNERSLSTARTRSISKVYNKKIHPADRMKTHNAYEKGDRCTMCSIGTARMQRATGGGQRRESRRISRGEHRVSPSGRGRPSHLAKRFRSNISDFFDGYHDDNIYFNSPYEYLPNTTDSWKYNHMGIIIGTVSGTTRAMNRIASPRF